MFKETKKFKCIDSFIVLTWIQGRERKIELMPLSILRKTNEKLSHKKFPEKDKPKNVINIA